ncbi:hypothetical protein FQR65_LT01142 [Abscondita terminalis]|nr:hypothetical protein FQR65_LT01142 [Abscondita terminalis]
MSLNFLLLIVIFGTALAITVHQYAELHQQAPVLHHHSTPIPILKLEHEQSKEGYKFSYQTGNGIHAQEHGYIKNYGDKKHETLVQHGSVTYHDEHGHPITLTYVADEHGFQPQGAHLPTPPPVPLEHQQHSEGAEQHIPVQENYGESNFEHADYSQNLHV